MARSWLAFAAFLLMGIYAFIPTSGQPVVLGDSFNFSATSQPQCPPGAELKLLHILLNGTAVPVASRDDSGSWKPPPSYTDRLNQSDSALVLTHINYNDNGLYEFTCGGGGEGTRIHLDVMVPIKFSVFENDTVHFPCYAVTVGGDVKSAWWKINGQSVVKMNPASQKITTGHGYNRRVSVPTDWFSKGDFTLTLGPVQLQDQGDYICSIQDQHGKSRMYKIVARLKVQETRNQTSTKQSGPFHVTDQESSRHTVCVAVAVVVALVLCAVAFGIGWWMRSRRSSPPPPPPPPRPQREGAQEDVSVPLVSQNEPGLQTNGLAFNGHR